MNESEKNDYEMVGEIVSIFRRGQRWWANFQHDGKQHRQSLATTSKKEARRKALVLEAQLIEGRYHRQVKPVTVQEAIDAYMKFAKTEGRAKKTTDKYTKIFDGVKKLAEELHRTNLLGIDLKFIDEFRHRRVAAGRAPKTIYNETIVIRQLVNFALAREMIATDPLKGLKLKKPKPTSQPYWTAEEVERILAASPLSVRPAFTILWETGIRVGELRWLTWDDVDFDRNVVHIRPKDAWKPKTGDQRAIPMSPKLKKLLQELSRCGRWVLTAPPSAKHPEEGAQISDRGLLKSLKCVLKRLGLKGKIHSFRHSFISHALTSGVPEAVLRVWVGHVDHDVMKLYTHIANTDSQSAMQRLAEARKVC